MLPIGYRIYAAALGSAGLGVLAWLSWQEGLAIDQPLAVGVFLALALFTLQFGFVIDKVGYTSLDRVVQVSSVLIFGPLIAAWITVIAVVAWLAATRRDSPNFQFLWTRAAHAAGMMALVILAAGYLYKGAGGAVPLVEFGLRELLLTLMLAVVLQLLNDGFMAVSCLMRGMPLKDSFAPLVLFIELATFPLAVLTALVFNLMAWPVVALFFVVLAGLTMIVSGLIRRGIVNTELLSQLNRSKVELEDKVTERTLELQATAAQKETLLRVLEEKTGLLERQAHEDPLTGLNNRRFMGERLAHEFKRARRFGRDFVVAMVDLDRFKQVNDAYSHAVGDEALRRFATLLRENCRSIDVIARYGGEEFVLYFPETTLANAATVCEKIRKAAAEHPWHEIAPGVELTVSVGIADDADASDPEEVLAAADRRLYEAKTLGRDRVCF